MRSLAINLLVAVCWLLLQAEATLVGVVVGLVLGFGMLALFRDVVGSQDYVRRVTAAGWFLIVFAREFLLACKQLFRAALWLPRSRLAPRIIIYDTAGLSKLEALLLSHAISLTPGTTTVDISPDFRHFTLHVLECHDPDAVREGIDRTLKRGLLAFTR
jgi:multicomponent Na+:H+ antiporter subunit E